MRQQAQAESALTDNEILRKYDTHIRRLARRFGSPSEDDYAQLGRMALVAAARLWRSKPPEMHTAKFWSYAYHRVLGAMIRAASGEMEMMSEAVVSDGDVVDRRNTESVFGAAFVPPDVALEARELVACIASERNARVLAEHLEGEDIRSIAERTGLRKSTAHDILKGTIESLRDSA